MSALEWIELANRWMPSAKCWVAMSLPFFVPMLAETASRRCSAALRYNLWLIALGCASLAPMAMIPRIEWSVSVPAVKKSVLQNGTANPEPRSSVDDVSLPPVAARSASRETMGEIPHSQLDPSSTSPVEPSSASSVFGASPNETTVVHSENAYAAWIALGYASIAILLLLRLVRMHYQAYMLRRRSTPIDIHSLFRAGYGEFTPDHRTLMATTDELNVPAVIGIWRPTILLPSEADQWDPNELRCIVRHEVAHIQRSDILWHSIACCLRALFWIHPGYWIGCNRMLWLRELACDDVAVGASSERFAYGESLISMALELSRHPRRELGISSVSAMGSVELEKRLGYLVNLRQSRKPTSWPIHLALLFGLISLVGTVGMTLPSSLIATYVPLETTEPVPSTSSSQVVAEPSNSEGLFDGTITDRQGNPIAGVRLSPAYFDAGEMSNAERTEWLRSMEIETDADGYFEWDTAKKPAVLKLSAIKFGYRSEFVDIEGPRRRSIVLANADFVRGSVQDANQIPVVGAKVGVFFDSDVAATIRNWVETDEDGEFEYPGVTRPQVHLVAINSRGEPGILRKVNANSVDHVIRLVPTTSITLETLDPLGAPIPDVQVQLGSWNQCGVVQWSGRSDANGEVRWENAPTGTLAINCRKAGYQIAWTKFDSGSNASHKVTMYPPQELTGTVVDAVTGLPIDSFVAVAAYDRPVSGLMEGEEYPLGNLPSAYQQNGIQGARGKSGKFTYRSELGFSAIRFTIHAEGYDPLETESIPASETRPMRSFGLVRTKQLEGTPLTILYPDGSVAGNVQVRVYSPGRGSRLEFDPDVIEASRIRDRAPASRTDSNGVFILGQRPNGGTITAWGETGWYFGDLSALDPSVPLSLEPYCRLKVRFPERMRNQRLANYVLQREIGTSMGPSRIESSTHVPIELQEVDENGFIEIKHALGGPLKIADWTNRPGRSIFGEVIASFAANANEETIIDLRGSSEFIGRLTLPADALARLEQMRVIATRTDAAGQVTSAYRVDVQADGSFEFTELPAGEYVLTVAPIALSAETAARLGLPKPDRNFPSNFRAHFDLVQRVSVGPGERLELDTISLGPGAVQ